MRDDVPLSASSLRCTSVVAHRRNNTGYLFFISLKGWDWVHLVLRQLFGLLYQLLMTDDCRATGGMRIGRGNRSTRRKPCPSVTLSTINSTTWSGLEPGPSRWEAGD
jgi:hypothetical protein